MFFRNKKVKEFIYFGKKKKDFFWGGKSERRKEVSDKI